MDMINVVDSRMEVELPEADRRPSQPTIWLFAKYQGKSAQYSTMVRYIAPQFDQTDDNDDQEEATPMDWEIISDNECENEQQNLSSTSLVKHYEQQQEDDYESIEYHKNELLRIEEEEYHQCRLEQYTKKKWKRILQTAITIAIVIIAIVLKRHAPPPPPIVYQSPFIKEGSLPNYSTDNSATNSINNEDSITTASYSNDLLQHETWSQYTNHILNLLHQTLRYSISVTYYTISNSLYYTYEEVYDVCVDVLSSRSSGGVSVSSVKSAIKSWLEKLSFLDDISAWFNEMIQRRKTDNSSTQDMNDIRNHEDEVVACPIQIPSSSANINQQQQQYNKINQVIPTEDKLRQTIGVSLSPQNLALQLIADRLDTWGLESPSLQQAHSVGQTKIDAELILPPAMGLLIVGSDGVGKLHIARRLSYLLLGHCSSSSTSPWLLPAGNDDQDSPLTGVLQVNAASFDYQSIMELIVFHIHSRTNLGSVVIIQHVEEMDKRALLDILEVLNGISSTLSYKMKTNGDDDKVVETSCNGTVFIMTSKLWGIESIYQHLPQTTGRKGVHKYSLISSIRQEVTTMASRFDSSIQVSSMTIVPILPFQHEDLSSILQGRIQGINLKYQGDYWKNLVVSLAAIRYHVGVDHINFSDTYTANDGEEIDMALSYSTNGAHSINNNILWQRLHTGITAVDQRRPKSTLKVDIDEDSKELRFSWCKIDNGMETCQVESWN